MFLYAVKRIGIGIITLLVLVTLTFFLTRLVPGNPFEGENVSQAALDKLTAQYGLDKPIAVQYVTYLKMVLHGDFGESLKKPGIPVTTLIARGAPVSMRLGLVAWIVSHVLGIVVGVIEATTRSRAMQTVLLSVTTFFTSIPNFILAIVMMLILGVWLKALPIVGLATPKHWIMPMLALIIGPVASTSRLVHTTFTEAMKHDYVTMARSKGLSWTAIRYKHILKNALIPVVSSAGPSIASVLTGSFVVESLFSIPGIGMDFVGSVTNRDFTLIMGMTIFIGSVIILCNLAVDLLLPLVDPRVRIS